MVGASYKENERKIFGKGEREEKIRRRKSRHRVYGKGHLTLVT